MGPPPLRLGGRLQADGQTIPGAGLVPGRGPSIDWRLVGVMRSSVSALHRPPFVGAGKAPPQPEDTEQKQAR